MKLILPFPKRSRESALGEVPAEVRFVLGDRHYDTPALCEFCEQAERLVAATQYGSYPHIDNGVDVRRIIHKLHSEARRKL